MNQSSTARLLSIGEFAAATRLSLKALRLYDEQRLLPPTRIDTANGYRYYAREQVVMGRLIRSLREMNLPLSDIARVVMATDANVERVLDALGSELDRRYAREKRAFQTALMLQRNVDSSAALPIASFSRVAMHVAVLPFDAVSSHLFEGARMALATLQSQLRKASITFTEQAYCNISEPLAEEETQVELLIPLLAESTNPDIATRRIAATQCAMLEDAELHRGGIGAAQDALFDWFDRKGYRAVDTPWVAMRTEGAAAYTAVWWAYEDQQ